MFSFVRNGRKTNLNETRQEVLKYDSRAVNLKEVINLEPYNIPANGDGTAVDRLQEGYGTVTKSGGRFRGSPYNKKKSDSQS